MSSEEQQFYAWRHSVLNKLQPKKKPISLEELPCFARPKDRWTITFSTIGDLKLPTSLERIALAGVTNVITLDLPQPRVMFPPAQGGAVILVSFTLYRIRGGGNTTEQYCYEGVIPRSSRYVDLYGPVASLNLTSASRYPKAQTPICVEAGIYFVVDGEGKLGRVLFSHTIPNWEEFELMFANAMFGAPLTRKTIVTGTIETTSELDI